MADLSSRVALVQLMSPEGQWENVGFLRNRNEITRFEHVRTYWSNPNRPILGQVFEERGQDWTPSQRVAVPTWFSHLLPEGYLRSAVSAALGTKPQREFPMLVRIGEDDLPGAVRVIMSDEPDVGDPLIDEFHTHENDDSDDDPVLKFSLAGVQPKFSVILDSVRGLTIPTRGQAGDYIVKLPDGRPGFEQVPEAELGSLKLAEAIGINTPEARLVDVNKIKGLPRWAASNSGKALAVKRFDRLPHGQRVHAEVFAQILDVPTANDRLKYTRANLETVASITMALCGPSAAMEVIDRIVLNILLGNGDAHLKNWAVVYPDGFNAELSPAFDILPTVLFIKNDDLGMKLGGSRSFVAVTQGSFTRLAGKLGFDNSEVQRRVASAVGAISNHWPILEEYLSAERFAEITKRRDNLPLFKFGEVL